MPYVAKFMQRHNEKLYQKGDEMPLSYADAQELMKHKAIERVPVAVETAAKPSIATNRSPLVILKVNIRI